MNKPGHPFSRTFVDKSTTRRLDTKDLTNKLLRNKEVSAVLDQYQDNIARYAFIKSVKKTIIFRNKIILAMGTLNTEESTVLSLTLFFNKKIIPPVSKKAAYSTFIELLRIGEFPQVSGEHYKDKFDFKEIPPLEKDTEAIEEIKDKLVSGSLKSSLGDYDYFV